MRIIWNIDYCGDNSNSEYFLPRGHENPRFYPCERFIPGSLSVRGYDRFNEIVSVDGALMINGEPMTREQAVTMEVPEGHQILGVYCLLDETGDRRPLVRSLTAEIFLRGNISAVHSPLRN